MSKRLIYEERAALRQRYRGPGFLRPSVADIERCLNALDASEAANVILRLEHDGLLRVSEAQVEMYHHLENTLQEARSLLEEAIGFSDNTGVPDEDALLAVGDSKTTESLLGRIIIFLQRTEGREGGAE